VMGELDRTTAAEPTHVTRRGDPGGGGEGVAA
jgi:hypothetical protein